MQIIFKIFFFFFFFFGEGTEHLLKRPNTAAYLNKVDEEQNTKQRNAQSRIELNIQILALPSNTHGCILHRGIAGAFWRYGATEKVGQKINEKMCLSLSKRNKKDSFVSLSVNKPSARISSCGSRVSYGVIAFPSYMEHDFEMFTAAGLRPVRS